MKITLLILTTLTLLSCNSQKRKNIEPTRTVDEKVELADKLTDQGDYQKAIQVLLTIDQPTAESDYLLGFSYLRIQEYNKAISAFEKVYQENPEYRNTCFNLAQCLLEKTNWNQPSKESVKTSRIIIKYLTDGINYKTGNIPDDYLAQYHANRGQMLQLNSEYEQALSDFNIAIKLDAQGDYYSRRAMTHHFMGNNDMACQDFETGKALGETYVEEEINKICR